MLIVIASDRRFHAALEQPYWSMLDNHLAARLWRALGRPGATRPVLVRRVSLCQWLHACVVSESGHPACSCILIKHISVCQGARPAGPQSIRALVHPLTAAGTREEASARRWLQAQGSAIRSLRGLSVGLERSGLGDVPGRDLDAGRLSTLLASIPSVTFICVDLRLDLHPIPTAAAIRPFLARAAHAIGRCSGLQTLRLGVDLLGGLSDQLPEALVRELAGARALKEVFLHFGSREADRPRWPAAFSLAHVMAGLAGLSRLRMLHLYVGNVSMEATLPASVSCLSQLTALSLCGFHGLRCERGWSRLPALGHLKIADCVVFSGNGEAALPNMDALAALTCFDLRNCPSLRLLPVSLWQLPQLRRLGHRSSKWALARVPPGALPVAGLPAHAPCFVCLTHLTLEGHNMPVFPPGIMAMSRLGYLSLSHSCFERLPEGMSVLTDLEVLHLARGSSAATEVGGALDARALGSLTGFRKLRSLGLANCSVLFCSDFQAAAAHPCLERLQLHASYPAPGLSLDAFLAFATTLQQQGRSDVLKLSNIIIEGAGRQDSCDFWAALRAVGYL